MKYLLLLWPLCGLVFFAVYVRPIFWLTWKINLFFWLPVSVFAGPCIWLMLFFAN